MSASNIANKSKEIDKPKEPNKPKYTKAEIFIIFIVLMLMFINTASLNMLVPSYGSIIADFGIDRSLIYLPDSLLVLVSAVFSVVWGYYTDRIDRGKIIMGGAFLSAFGFLYSAFCNDFTNLLIARLITGAGMGCIMPVGISILGDVVPPEERSGWFGFLAIFSSLSNAAGNGMSAFLGPLNLLKGRYGWQFPFIVLSILAIFVVILLIFGKLPEVGSKEEDLAQLQTIEELEYGYMINKKELLKMLQKPTNKYLIINGFFSIVPGTILVFVLITTLSDPNDGMFAVLPAEIRTQVSTIMAGLVGVGYLIGNLVLSNVGDKLYKKNKRYRALLAFITQALAIPLCMIMIFMIRPISLSQMPDYPNPIPNADVMGYVVDTLIAIFKNYPNYVWFFVFSFLGSFFGAGFVPNKNAIMIDVNLPEHRGTATSFFQLTEQLGKSATLMLASALLIWLNSYKNMLYLSMLFWIPSALLWYLTSLKIQKDLDDKAMVLRERTQVSFIDYFFELEMATDDGVQLIQDAKDLLVKDPKRAEKAIDEAIKKFKWIVMKAHKQKYTEIEAKTANLMNNALMFKGDLLMLNRNPPPDQLKQLYKKIDTIWDESDFGKIEVLYEGGYLKVCEARLRRNYNPLESSGILDGAIEVYDRVIHLVSDRIIEEGSKKLSKEEEQFQERIASLMVLAQKSKSNTELLKHKLDLIVTTVLEKNVSKEDLGKMIELTSDFGLKLDEVVADTFEGKTAREIKHIMNEIDELFTLYDEWQKNE